MASTDDYRPNEYVTEQGLYERYLIPPRTAQRWRSTGDGPSWIRLGRRRVLYRVSDVEEWLRAHTYRHRADELARAVDVSTTDMANSPAFAGAIRLSNDPHSDPAAARPRRAATRAPI